MKIPEFLQFYYIIMPYSLAWLFEMFPLETVTPVRTIQGGAYYKNRTTALYNKITSSLLRWRLETSHGLGLKHDLASKSIYHRPKYLP